MADTGEEPLDPDAVITVAFMRDVLVNYVELYLGLDDFVVTLEGEDDEMVMDLGVRLADFPAIFSDGSGQKMNSIVDNLFLGR